MSIKFQNSKTLLQILLQFTCSKTNGLPSALCPLATATHSSSASSSVSLLSRFSVGSSLSAIFHAAVMCAWIAAIPVSPDAHSLEVSAAVHGQSPLIFCLPPLIPHSLEQCFSTFVRPRPGKFSFYKTRARSQQIYS